MPATPWSKPETYRAALADGHGDAYAAVIYEAGRRQYILTASAPPGRMPDEDLLDPNLAASHLRDTVTLGGVQLAAAVILCAPPLNMGHQAANALARLHTGRMAQHFHNAV